MAQCGDRRETDRRMNDRREAVTNATMKTVRFTQVVERSGAPELHPLWTAPEKDAEFQRAVKAGRVMTLAQANVGSKRDRGVVGYAPGEHAQFLIFPRSLKPFAGREVIGVKYELLHDPKVSEPYHAPAPKPKKRPKPELHVKIVDDDTRGVADDDGEEAANAHNVVAFEHVREPDRGRASRNAGRAQSSRRTAREKQSSRAAGRSRAVEQQLTKLVAEARRVLTALKQGKTVAAYERLAAAVDEVGKGD